MFSFFKKNEASEPKNRHLHLWLMIAGAVLGVTLLLFGGRSDEKNEVTQEVSQNDLSRETQLYREQLEHEIKTLCERVSGVEGVTVAVSLEGSFTEVYATEGEDGKYVIVGSGSSAAPLFLSRDTPRITGIGVVCRGGSSPSIQRELTALLSATFDLPTNRIYVTEAK